MESISNGAWAHHLIERNLGRLVELQVPVLAEDGDPEPLHRMRVAMRRLRTALRQFAPALVLPDRVSEQRIARTGRRLGLARDLDVLRGRLERELMPDLPDGEVRALRPVLRQLRRERRLAGEQLAGTLRAGAYLKLLKRLQAWLRDPCFTPLGHEPLADWLLEWQVPLLAALPVHPGWSLLTAAEDPEAIHGLRKRCKNARYCLENLQPFNGEAGAAWADQFHAVQDLLGELNDLEVLRRAIDDQLPGQLADTLPALSALVQSRSEACWQRWRAQAQELQRPERRHGLLADLLVVTSDTAAGS